MNANFIGNRFGKLIVLSVADDKVYTVNGKSRRLKRYNVQCDCGNSSVVFGQDLRSNKTKSCGASTCKIQYDDRSMVAFNRVYSAYKRQANKRNLQFNIDINTFRDITKDECYYCGIKESNVSKVKSGNSISEYSYNGIDRIDNDLGYIPDNIVSCCNQCNHAKHTMSQSDYIALAMRIAQKHGS